LESPFYLVALVVTRIGFAHLGMGYT